jgi:hypothetical protein
MLEQMLKERFSEILKGDEQSNELASNLAKIGVETVQEWMLGKMFEQSIELGKCDYENKEAK